MKYKAIVKSPKEIIGIDCDAFSINITKDSQEIDFYYTWRMYTRAGEEIILEKLDEKNKYDYISEDDHYWLESWLKDIEPISYRKQFEEDTKLSNQSHIIYDIAYYQNYSSWLEMKLREYENKEVK